MTSPSIRFQRLVKQLIQEGSLFLGINSEYIHRLVLEPLWDKIKFKEERSGLSAEIQSGFTMTGYSLPKVEQYLIVHFDIFFNSSLK